MKKLLLVSMVALAITACSSTEENKVSQISRETTQVSNWWEAAGDPASEYWWINTYEDSTNE